MNKFRNTVFLTGIAGSDPKIINLSDDKKVARVSLAINESYTTKAGELIKSTHWFNLVCWNKKVALVEDVVKKGSRFSIEGRLVNTSYVDKSGINRTNIEVVVRKLEVGDELFDD